jgi:hypothetical protein
MPKRKRNDRHGTGYSGGCFRSDEGTDMSNCGILALLNNKADLMQIGGNNVCQIDVNYKHTILIYMVFVSIYIGVSSLI